MKVTIEIEVPDATLSDIISTAVEGGIMQHALFGEVIYG